MMGLAVYLRVSTKRQEIASQTVAIQQWLTGHNLTPHEWFLDKETGTTMQRPAFQRVQASIFNGNTDHVVMYSLDRFARSMLEGLVEIDRWQQQKVRLTFVYDQIELDFRSWQGEIMAKMLVAMKLAMAEMEHQKITARARAGRLAAAERVKQAKKLKSDGWNHTQIANHLGVTLERLERMLTCKQYYWGGSKAGWTKVDRDKLRKLKQKGLSNTEIANLLGCHRITVGAQLKQIDLAAEPETV
jgi:DNA invertase Pin-like site-specific DNA recombinase